MSVIAYQSRTVPGPPSDFDFHFEQELSRRLRRRFMWYCAVTILLSLLILIPGFLSGRPAVQVGAGPVMQPPELNRLSQLTSLLSLGMYIAALVFVLLKKLRREQVLRLAMWLYVLATIPGLIGARLTMQVIMPIVADQAIAEQERERERRQALEAAGFGRPPPPTERDRPPEARPAGGIPMRPPVLEARPNPATRPASQPTSQRAATVATVRGILSPAIVFLFASVFVLLLHHTFVCLFIPWTLRQSLMPAGILMVVVLVIVLLDVAGGAMPWGWVPPAILLPITGLMFVPGSAFCWWRFSRMRRDILLNFESSRLHALQSEMNSAKRILESALPQPRTTGPVHVHYVYEPMRQIGGDLLFVHPPADKPSSVHSVVLLDVTGHGVAAALAVNRLIGELERLFAESPDATPADVLSALNRYVHFTMARHDMYVTAVALRLDADAGRLTFASAGHPTAFLWRADGTIIDLESTTMLLGIVDGSMFSPDPVEFDFGPGDTVIAYTDGASEATCAETMIMLGIEGVKRTVHDVARAGRPPADWPTEVMRRVAAFRNSPPADDTLLVTIHRPA